MPDSLKQKEQDELELLEEEEFTEIPPDVPTGQDPDGTTDLGIPWENPEEPDQPTVVEYLASIKGDENPLGKSRIGVTKKLYKNPADAKKARKLAKKMRTKNRHNNSHSRG